MRAWGRSGRWQGERAAYPDLEAAARLRLGPGFEFAEADLDALRPAIERALDALERLHRLPLGAIEPVTHYRVI